MLEEFSYTYKEADIEKYWFMKVWPVKIQAALTDGRNTIFDKNELFGARLEKEKEEFTKLVTTLQGDFEGIKEFKSLEGVQQFFINSHGLRKAIDGGFKTVGQFHERETLFGLPNT